MGRGRRKQSSGFHLRSEYCDWKLKGLFSERALWSRKQRRPRTFQTAPTISRILTTWQTPSYSVVSEPVWSGGEERKTRGETEAPHSNGGGGGGRSHLASILLEERTSLSILFSSKAGHSENHLTNVCVCVCTWKPYEVNRENTCVHVWVCLRTCYKPLSFTYRALGPQEVSGL